MLALITTVLPLVLPLIGKLLPDPEAQRKLELALIDWARTQDAAQIEVNKVDAMSGNLMQAGWRPFIGWSCGIGLIYEYGGHQVVAWAGQVIGWFVLLIAPLFGGDATQALSSFPTLPSIGQSIGKDGPLWELLMGILGLGGLRTYEKTRSGHKTMVVEEAPSGSLARRLAGNRS